MKVEGPNKTGGVKGPNKTIGKSAAGGASFSGLLEGPDEVEGKGGVAGAAPVATCAPFTYSLTVESSAIVTATCDQLEPFVGIDDGASTL